ncbi:MAG TPA: hypothetical protein VE998_04640, partial [Terriglobales bacterium]|nr:hypothetical protein [Terriglobales bacterium]
MATVSFSLLIENPGFALRPAARGRLAAAALLAIAACALLTGCGGGSSSNTSTSNPVTITLVPSSATVTTGTTEQFTATVTNASNTAVTYQVNNVTGGSSTTGTINTSGLYSAPNTVPNPNTVEIEAISQQDSSKKATASVTITLPPPSTHIDISPSSATVPAGGVQTFSAAINGKPLTTVAWSLGACSSSVPNACGTVNATTGVYTAPLSPPPGGQVSLTATDTNPNDNTPSANASITVQFGNGTLAGQYTFDVAGTGTAIAGSFSMDGIGGLSNGSADLNSGGSASSSAVTGSYQLGNDGRGTLTTNLGTFSIAMVNHNHGYLLRRDSAVAPMIGTIDLQNSLQFALPPAGNYTLGFANHGANLSAEVAGAGAFQTDGSGAVTSGTAQLDVNAGGSVTSSPGAAGSLAAPSGPGGRGTFTFGGRSFAYYVIDATHSKLIELDATPAVGDLFKQNAGPYTTTSLSGSFAAVLNGFTSP